LTCKANHKKIKKLKKGFGFKWLLGPFDFPTSLRAMRTQAVSVLPSRESLAASSFDAALEPSSSWDTHLNVGF